MLKLLTLLSILIVFPVISKEVPKELQQKFKEVASKNMELRFKVLEEVHRKKISFENEMYELEKAQLNEAKSISEELIPGDKKKNKEIRDSLKKKHSAFQEEMKKRRKTHHEEIKQMRKKYSDERKANQDSLRAEWKNLSHKNKKQESK